jgi:hypothetical protein
MRAGQYKCRHCGRICVEKRKGQKYCGEKACQRSRKREWNRRKYSSDPDYRANQRESTEAWLSRQGGAAQYHRAYRRRRESETAAIQAKTAEGPIGGPERSPTEASRPETSIAPSLFAGSTTVLDGSANRDARSVEMLIKPGMYKICPVGADLSANRDPMLVELRVITS